MEGEASLNAFDSIILEIEGTKIQCDRADLTKNSDYFIAMLEGNFAEKKQNIISLKGVKLEAMKIILQLLRDTELTVAEENLLSVLQAACMLQFLQIKKICLEQVIKMLRPNNCISIWILADHLDLKELCNKAKLMSLLEFMFIKDSEEQYFLELTLDLILDYLGSVYLQCTNEFYVYEMLNIWFGNLEEKNADILKKLLHCINYTTLTVNEIGNIMDSQYVSQFETLKQSLKYVKALKNGDEVCHFKDEYVKLGNKLFSAKDRNLNGLPCILVDNIEEKSHLKPTIFYYDQYKRKRKYSLLGKSSSADYFVIYYDFTSQILKKLFAIGVTEQLEGFKILGHKKFIFIYGGEFQIGQGGWNYHFHIYDVIKEIWTKKRSPHLRRHFESCVCGNKVFIVGGTGPYRVIQKNMYWYDLETGEFSSLEMLPRSIIQLKCCEFQNELFILNINNKRGYIFDHIKRTWTTLKIIDAEEVLPAYSEQLTVFNYKNSIFVKEKNLYEMKIKDDKLVITNIVQISQVQDSNVWYHAEAVLIADTLYSLSKEWTEAANEQTFSLELFNINTRERSECFRRKNAETLEIDDEKFKFNSSPMTIFSMFHPNLVTKNDLINSE